MLKKYIIFCIITGTFLYWSFDFIDSGKCEDFILEHSESIWAPGSLYYLGNLFFILQNKDRAEEIYETVIEFYPDTQYYEPAFYKYFFIASYRRKKPGKREAVRRGKTYLAEFPESSKADVVRKKINFISHNAIFDDTIRRFDKSKLVHARIR